MFTLSSSPYFRHLFFVCWDYCPRVSLCLQLCTRDRHWGSRGSANWWCSTAGGCDWLIIHESNFIRSVRIGEWTVVWLCSAVITVLDLFISLPNGYNGDVQSTYLNRLLILIPIELISLSCLTFYPVIVSLLSSSFVFFGLCFASITILSRFRTFSLCINGWTPWSFTAAASVTVSCVRAGNIFVDTDELRFSSLTWAVWHRIHTETTPFAALFPKCED